MLMICLLTEDTRTNMYFSTSPLWILLRLNLKRGDWARTQVHASSILIPTFLEEEVRYWTISIYWTSTRRQNYIHLEKSFEPILSSGTIQKLFHLMDKSLLIRVVQSFPDHIMYSTKVHYIYISHPQKVSEMYSCL